LVERIDLTGSKSFLKKIMLVLTTAFSKTGSGLTA